MVHTVFDMTFSALKMGEALIACKGGCLKQMIQMRSLRFVEVIYDVVYGEKRPVGLIHSLRLPSGQEREVFTFCSAGRQQPDMALFVTKRKGNMAEDIALTFEGQDLIPLYLKHLPDEYKDDKFQELAIA